MDLDRLLENPPEGMASSAWPDFPVIFDTHENIITEVSEFTAVEAWMESLGMTDFEAEFSEHFPALVGIAVCDVDEAEEDDDIEVDLDTEAEFFLALDTESGAVMLWTESAGFEELSTSLDAFVDTLRPFFDE